MPYGRQKLLFFRAGACLGGLGLVLLSDYNPSVGGGSKPLFGDTLVIVGTVFLSMSSVGMEFYVKKKDRVEVMMMIGMFGILVSASGMAILERKGLESINWSPQLVLAYVGCTIASFMFHTLVPFVLKVKWLYYPAYTLVTFGIFIYLKTGNDPDRTQVVEDANLCSEYSILNEDNVDVRNGSLVQ